MNQDAVIALLLGSVILGCLMTFIHGILATRRRVRKSATDWHALMIQQNRLIQRASDLSDPNYKLEHRPPVDPLDQMFAEDLAANQEVIDRIDAALFPKGLSPDALRRRGGYDNSDFLDDVDYAELRTWGQAKPISSWSNRPPARSDGARRAEARHRPKVVIRAGKVVPA